MSLYKRGNIWWYTSSTLRDMKKLKQFLLKIFLPWVYYPRAAEDGFTEALHPEFGWVWRDEEIGGRLLKAAREAGIREGQDRFQKKVATAVYNAIRERGK